MTCLTDPLGCGISLLGSGASSVASSAWDSICQSFATAATSLLTEFAKGFVNIPDVDVASAGIKSVYAISLGIAAFISGLIAIFQVTKTVLTQNGRHLGQVVVGLWKSAIAFAITLTVAGAALGASDEVSRYIVTASFGSTAEFSQKISTLVAWNPTLSGSLLLIFAIIAILLVAVLWLEMLFRNAAVGILIATSPIPAAGQLGESTAEWWTKFVSTTGQLIALKPIIALVFAIGFSMAGDSQDIETTLSGMLVLLLGVIAWPAVARFFSFASVQGSGGMGLGALLGFAGGRLSAAADSSGGGGGGAAGVEPDQFGQQSAERTAAGFAGRSGLGGAGAGGAAAGSGGGAAAAGAQGAAVAATGPIGLALAGIKAATSAANAMTSGMEQMAGHAGLSAYPQGRGPGQSAGPASQGSNAPGGGGEARQAPGQQPGGAAPRPNTPVPPTASAAGGGGGRLPVTGAGPEPGFEQAAPPAEAAGVQAENPTLELPAIDEEPTTTTDEDS